MTHPAKMYKAVCRIEGLDSDVERYASSEAELLKSLEQDERILGIKFSYLEIIPPETSQQMPLPQPAEIK